MDLPRIVATQGKQLQQCAARLERALSKNSANSAVLDCSEWLRRAAGIPSTRWHLENAVAMHRKHPRSFKIYSERQRASLRVGDTVKLGFRSKNGYECMWVQVTRKTPHGYEGTMRSRPIHDEFPTFGDKVSFGPQHVLSIAFT